MKHHAESITEHDARVLSANPFKFVKYILITIGLVVVITTLFPVVPLLAVALFVVWLAKNEK